MGYTPIKIQNLKPLLQNYSNKAIGTELLQGFQFGFRIGYKGPRLSQKILKSFLQFPEAAREKINSEVSLGRIAGPFSNKPISNLRVSPIGIVPKSGGSWRLITHLSYPEMNSVNHFIDPEDCSVAYTSLDQVLQEVARLGKGTVLAKMDIKSAFRLMIINPGDFDLLGFKFEGNYYIDKCLPMGCAISCNQFEKFSTFLQWELKRRIETGKIFHYLDDFLFLGASGSDECVQLMRGFQDLCEFIGVPLAQEKTMGPCTNIIFLGLEIDTSDMVVRIPPEKIQQLTALLTSSLIKKSLQLQEIQSIVGSLNFFSKGVPNARAFNRRFYDATCGITKPHYHIKLSSGIKEDIMMWLKFLQDFNGVRLIHESEWLSSDNIELYTDSSGNRELGCGAYCQGHWSYWSWPLGWESSIFKEMSFLELVPILLAMYLWGKKYFANKKIMMYIDNNALVSIVNRQTSKSKRVMVLLRKLVLLLLRNDIMFKAQHILGKKNNIADSISRKQFHHFRQLAQWADLNPETIPDEFLAMMSEMK